MQSQNIDSKLRNGHQNNSYESRDYESVDDGILSYVKSEEDMIK